MPNFSADVSVQVLAGGRAAGVPDGVSAVRPRRGQLQRHAARPQEVLGSGVLTRGMILETNVKQLLID